MKTSLRQQGFSLIELSIVLVIIAIIAGSALSFGLTNREHVKLLETERKMDAIEQAIAAFVALNGRLPCPANGTLNFNPLNATADNRGEETKAAAATADCTGFTVNGNTIGVIPFTTLQLPESFLLDGWGNRFTYAVDAAHTVSYANVSAGPNFLDREVANATLVVNATTTPAIVTRTANAVYVLTSHGADGHGAFPKSGGTRINSGTTDADELENGDVDATFVQKSTTATFDDVVRYKIKPQVVFAAGKRVAAGNACKIARDIADGTIPNSCDSLASGSGNKNIESCNQYVTLLNEYCIE